MTSRRGWLGASVAVLLLAAGAWWGLHRPGKGLTVAPGALAVVWQGPHPGQMTLPAQMQWCPVTRVAVLEGIAGDSGMVVALSESNTIASGSYAILSPGAGNVRPSATAALRWMRMDRDSSLEQYRSTSGTFRLQLGAGTASGSVEVHMHSAASMSHDSLLLRGVFRAVPVTTTASGCA